eukprot:TRINITY_DN43580_c0_g1_i1.p1 TRINITY_DN43580_c0_g1~~TRINITY_DN43580_c0_g1_i1.p1  ORF type:complete len:239 (-),score=39.21 TRINITY_DN43580_c0_g1_i1:25-714(-)
MSSEESFKLVPLCHRIKEKQRVCAEKTKVQVQKLIETIQKAIQELEKCEAGQEQAVMEMFRKEVQKNVSSKTVENTTREFHKSISQFKDKVIDVDFEEDLCESIQGFFVDNKMDLKVLNQIIVEHFYREKQFEIGDTLAKEAGLENIEEIRQGYVAMQQVLEDLQNQKVESALEFVKNNRQNIEDKEIVDKFEFSLHERKFFSLFQSQNININDVINEKFVNFCRQIWR